MNQKKVQRKLLKQMEDAEYPTFWNRAFARFIDGVVYGIPFVFLFGWLHSRIWDNEKFLWLCIIVKLMELSAVYCYRIFFNKKFNGTPGKLLCKLKIVRTDDLPMTWTTAFKREIIYIVLSIVYLVIFYSIFFMNIQSISTFRTASALCGQSVFYKLEFCFYFIVFLIDVSKINSSKNRQALHDRIANTVVVFNYPKKVED